jgi:hypothetical protein
MSHILSPSLDDTFDPLDVLGLPAADAAPFSRDRENGGSSQPCTEQAYFAESFQSMPWIPASPVSMIDRDGSTSVHAGDSSGSLSDRPVFTMSGVSYPSSYSSTLVHAHLKVAQFNWDQSHELMTGDRRMPYAPQPIVDNTRLKQGTARHRKSISSADGYVELSAPAKRRESELSTNSSVPSFDKVDNTPKKIHLEKNRIAANKCRQKQKRHVHSLEEQERALESQREDLLALSKTLQEEVLGLRNEVLKHGYCNSPLIQNYIATTARHLVSPRLRP